MVPGINEDAIERATGRAWCDWITIFDDAGARTLAHGDITEVAKSNGAPSWWSQMLTVEYERYIGRRSTGQGNDGTFSVTASRKLPLGVGEAWSLWCTSIAGREAFDRVALLEPPTLGGSPARRRWRCDLDDGSRVVATVAFAGEGATLVAVEHGRLADEAQRVRWRAVWKGVLAAL